MAQCLLHSLVTVPFLLALVTSQWSGEDVDATYRWLAKPYTACSKTCEGTQTRRVYCEGRTWDFGAVFEADEDLCELDDPRLKPIESRSCGVECANYTWIADRWQDCTSICGYGKQLRRVVCQKITRLYTIVTSDNDCIVALGVPKPDTSRRCNSDCAYGTGPWSACSATCGNGTRYRTIFCSRTKMSGTRQTVTISNCDDVMPLDDRPPLYQACNLGFCCAYRWKADPYGQCSRICEGVQKRRVYCACYYPNGSSTSASDTTLCKNYDPLWKPISQRSCGTACPTNTWREGAWSSCSALCGPGFQRRQVTCQMITNSSTTIASDSDCHGGSKPSTIRCCLGMCKIVPGPWSACNISCGCGHQERNLTCVHTLPGSVEQTVAVTHCENDPTRDHDLPLSMRQCERRCYFWKSQVEEECSHTTGSEFEDRDVLCMRRGCDGVNQVNKNDCQNALSVSATKNTTLENPAFQLRSDCQNLTYVSGEWSRCIPDACDGHRNRTLKCYCDGVVTNVSRCDLKYPKRPFERESCNCTFTWQPGPWSECYANCVRRRSLYCIISETRERVTKSYCNANSTIARPDSSERCKYSGDKKTVTWQATAWSTCSKPCLVGKRYGQKQRTVTCIDRCNNLKADGCNQRSKPQRVKKCNTFPCHKSSLS